MVDAGGMNSEFSRPPHPKQDMGISCECGLGIRHILFEEFTTNNPPNSSHTPAPPQPRKQRQFLKI